MELGEQMQYMINNGIFISMNTIAYIIISVSVLISVYTDTKTYKILNKVVLPTLLIGIIATTYFGGWYAGVQCLLKVVIVTLILSPLFLLRFLGAGDIKLLSAIAAFWPYKEMLYIILYSFILGGIIGAVLLITRKNGLERFGKLFEYLKTCLYTTNIREYPIDKTDKKSIFRFSYAIAVGFCVFTLENMGYFHLFR